MRSLLAGNGESSVHRERIRRVKGTNDDWMGHGGASCGGAVLTLLANFHAESTRYLLSRSNCFPQAGMRQQQRRRRRRRGGSLGRRLPTPTQRTGFERDEREEGRAEGEGERGGMQNYLRYGRGHLCRNETSASSAQPNFGNSPSLFLFRVVDANSYPLVFLEFRTARNLAFPYLLANFCTLLLVSLSVSFARQTISLALISRAANSLLVDLAMDLGTRSSDARENISDIKFRVK